MVTSRARSSLAFADGGDTRHTGSVPLEEYRRKRDFARTPEPDAASLAPTTGRFVVQRHRATRLHYDFRLEIGGVLVSWAVPRGPSLDPLRSGWRCSRGPPHRVPRLRGRDPVPQYGAGDVIVWDWGTWEPEIPGGDPAADIAAGELKFSLRGEKLRGRFTIVRTGPGTASRGSRGCSSTSATTPRSTAGTPRITRRA